MTPTVLGIAFLASAINASAQEKDNDFLTWTERQSAQILQKSWQAGFDDATASGLRVMWISEPAAKAIARSVHLSERAPNERAIKTFSELRRPGFYAVALAEEFLLGRSVSSPSIHPVPDIQGKTVFLQDRKDRQRFVRLESTRPTNVIPFPDSKIARTLKDFKNLPAVILFFKTVDENGKSLIDSAGQEIELELNRKTRVRFKLKDLPIKMPTEL